MGRNYVIEDPSDDEVREAMIKELAARWNRINHEIEQHSWRSEDEELDEQEFLCSVALDRAWEKFSARHADADAYFGTSKGKAEHEALVAETEAEVFGERDRRIKRRYRERDLVEEMLHNLGARMARPYEHWNEDEKLMEYLERDR